MSNSDYMDGLTEYQKGMQDSLNRDLAAMDWPIHTRRRGYVNTVVTRLLLGNRNGTKWEVIDGVPPQIRIFPYEIHCAHG